MKTCRLLPAFFALTALSVLTFNSIAAPAAEKPANVKVRVLIVTGDDVGVHDWLACSAKAREFLAESGRCEVSVVGNPGIFDDAKQLEKIDVVYLSMCNVRTPSLSAAGRENLAAFVRNGGGLSFAHYAANAFSDWPGLLEITGRRWVSKVSGHGPRGPFQCEVVDHDHFITAGLKDFETDDELYAKLQGEGDIHVLVQADSDWSKATEPMAFTREYGKGRVFYSAFGHDVRAMSTPAVRQLLVNGTLWAARHEGIAKR